jgi:hypothetical protein
VSARPAIGSSGQAVQELISLKDAAERILLFQGVKAEDGRGLCFRAPRAFRAKNAGDKQGSAPNPGESGANRLQSGSFPRPSGRRWNGPGIEFVTMVVFFRFICKRQLC